MPASIIAGMIGSCRRVRDPKVLGSSSQASLNSLSETLDSGSFNKVPSPLNKYASLNIPPKAALKEETKPLVKNRGVPLRAFDTADLSFFNASAISIWEWTTPQNRR